MRVGSACRLAAAAVAALSALSLAAAALAQPAEVCAEFTDPGEPRAYLLSHLLFLCEAPPCYNQQITDMETGATTAVAAAFACPADPEDRAALQDHVWVDVGEIVSVIGFLATWDGYGEPATVLIATDVGPELR